MKFFLFILVLLFTGCTSKEVVKQPKWLDGSPYAQDKLSAIGCAYIHISGESEQKKLAISRAIEQIALQKKSQVSVLAYRTKAAELVTSEVSSLQQVDAEKISTKVIDTYKDPSGNVCVLVSEE